MNMIGFRNDPIIRPRMKPRVMPLRFLRRYPRNLEKTSNPTTPPRRYATANGMFSHWNRVNPRKTDKRKSYWPIRRRMNAPDIPGRIMAKKEIQPEKKRIGNE